MAPADHFVDEDAQQRAERDARHHKDNAERDPGLRRREPELRA